MGEGTDAVRESTPRKLVAVGADDPRAPWWWNAALKALAMIGIPGALCAWLLYERATVLHEFTTTLQKAVVLLEKIAAK